MLTLVILDFMGFSSGFPSWARACYHGAFFLNTIPHLVKWSNAGLIIVNQDEGGLKWVMM
jgi:hypothetical protein